ncbi:MAG: hypothetical protein M0C28_45175 [Candidatus Moduliflexus flocculans]|nr:hypothetical protein [Candidatus Moduliflexus flocculans]
MTVFGLHVLDFAIVCVFIVFVLWLGWRASRKTKTTDDFFMAGRRLGKVYQFFLNLGTSTNADQAVAVSREVYRQGIGGMWIQYLVLFLTPFYWFTTAFFRRVRLATIGDFFTERFKSRFLGGAFAVFTLCHGLHRRRGRLHGRGQDDDGPDAEGRGDAARSGRDGRAGRPLRGVPGPRGQSVRCRAYRRTEKARYQELERPGEEGRARGLSSSYTDPMLVLRHLTPSSSARYTMMGGLLGRGHDRRHPGHPDRRSSRSCSSPSALSARRRFRRAPRRGPGATCSGSSARSATQRVRLVHDPGHGPGQPGLHHRRPRPGMQTAGSAKNEMTARVGMIGGMFFKRILMIFWALTGLLAIALYAGQLHDPDLIWGHMTMDLLFPGAIGLMLAGVLSAKMSSLSGPTRLLLGAFHPQPLPALSSSPSPTRHLLNVGRVDHRSSTLVRRRGRGPVRRQPARHVPSTSSRCRPSSGRPSGWASSGGA